LAERWVSYAQAGGQKGEPRAKRAVSFSREMAAAVGAVARRLWLDAEGAGRLRASWWALAGAAANFGRGVPVVGLGSAAESAPRMLWQAVVRSKVGAGGKCLRVSNGGRRAKAVVFPAGRL